MTLDECKSFTSWFAKRLLVGLFAFTIVAFIFTPRDDSDALDGARSNLAVRTDARTGCQYLETGRGGITPRLDVAGRQVGCR